MTGFLSLGLFTAHVTGNLVVIAALRGLSCHLTMTRPSCLLATLCIWAPGTMIGGIGGERVNPSRNTVLAVEFRQPPDQGARRSYR